MSFVITADRDGQPGLGRRLVEWVTTGTWDESRAFLTDHADELLTEPAEAALVQLVADNPDEQVLQLHLELLTAARAGGIEAAYGALLESVNRHALAELIVAWVGTQSWEEARAFFDEHEDALSTDEGEVVAAVLAADNPDQPDLLVHRGLLTLCRVDGADKAFELLLDPERLRTLVTGPGGRNDPAWALPRARCWPVCSRRSRRPSCCSSWPRCAPTIATRRPAPSPTPPRCSARARCPPSAAAWASWPNASPTWPPGWTGCGASSSPRATVPSSRATTALVSTDRWADACAALAAADPALGAAMADHGPCTLARRRTPGGAFAALARSVCYQQLAGAAAGAIHGRFAALYGGRPTPAAVVATPEQDLRAVGLSAAKVASIQDLAAKALDGTVRLQGWSRLDDDEIVERLIRVRGIGPGPPRCSSCSS